MNAAEAAAETRLEPPMPTTPSRGDALLLHHVLAVGGAEQRVPARRRLADALGSELAELLVGALQERRAGSSSP
jgi:hypothetical protein